MRWNAKPNPTLFVWIPIGLQPGVKVEDLTWAYHLLVVLAALVVLARLCASHR